MKLAQVLQVMYHFGNDVDAAHNLTSAQPTQFCVSVEYPLPRNTRVRITGQEWMVTAVRKDGTYLDKPLYRMTIVA